MVTSPGGASSTGKPNLTVEEADTIKGVLILAIVLGNNALLTGAVPWMFRVLYSFHVFGLLLLPFLVPIQKFSARLARTLAVRYLVPFVAFYLLYCAAFFVLQHPSAHLASWLEEVGIGLVVASANTLKDATGFRLLWLLPTLFTLRMLMSSYERTNSEGKLAIVLATAFCHEFVGRLPESAKTYLPLGLPLVAFVFVLGLVARDLWRRVPEESRAAAASVAFLVTVALTLLSLSLNSRVNLAIVQLYSIFDLAKLATHDVIIVASFLAIVSAAKWLQRSAVLRAVGKQSLGIYLIHSLVFYALFILYKRLGISREPLAIATKISVYILTVAASYFLSRAIVSTPTVRRFVFPRSWEDWRGETPPRNRGLVRRGQAPTAGV